jgi:hypothetical protein
MAGEGFALETNRRRARGLGRDQFSTGPFHPCRSEWSLLVSGEVLLVPFLSRLPNGLSISKFSSEQYFDSIVFEFRRPMRVAPFHDSSGVPMCDKCVELDGKIEHYQRLSDRIKRG